MAAPPDDQKTWLIVGASRGIGHEFARQALERGDRVFATVRNLTMQHDINSWTSATLDRDLCTPLECDVLSEDSIDDLASKLATFPDVHIDYAILNAGVLRYPNRATEMSYENFAFHLQTNTVGPIICAQRLLKADLHINTLVFISSDSGSVTNFREMEDGFAAYAASKAALNQAARHMAAELKRKGSETIILLLHPGEVKTDMASNTNVSWEVVGQMTPQESVSACIETIEGKGREDSGTFWTWENKPYPW